MGEKPILGASLSALEGYLASTGYVGWDCYDGLNSRLFQATPFRRSRLCRLALIQLCKRSPINLRPILRVPRGRNPKGTALLLMGFCDRFEATGDPAYETLARQCVDWLKQDQSTGYSGACWGYHFDWQSRAFFQPKFTPTVVATSFVGKSLLRAHQTFGWPELLALARQACDFVLRDLNRHETEGGLCLSYSPKDRSRVFNASLLGARLLSQVYGYTQEAELVETAESIVRFAVAHQGVQGEWVYGTAPFQNWIDSFHTGFNLECIQAYREASGDHQWDAAIQRGLRFYREHFFLDDGTPKYYADRIYPIDVHAPAQAVITCHALKEHCPFDVPAFCEQILTWTVEHMQHPKEGYFYFQKWPHRTDKTPYLRWSQAWMHHALSHHSLRQADSQSGIEENLAQRRKGAKNEWKTDGERNCAHDRPCRI